MKNGTCYLVYDETCPICQWYSGEFVKRNILPEKGRISFAELASRQQENLIEFPRAQNEIPLVFPDEKLVKYGPEALVYLLSKPFPFLLNAWKFRFFRQVAYLLYYFVSINRRIIPISGESSAKKMTKPVFIPAYRIAYLMASALLAILLTYQWGKASYLLEGHAWNALLAAGGGWTGILAFLLFRQGWKSEVVGHTFTVMAIGTFYLIPVILFPQHLFVEIICLLFSFLMMHYQIFRRYENIRWYALWAFFLMATFTTVYLLV